MSSSEILDRYAWWAALNHGGLLIAPSKLAEHFPADLPPLARPLEGRLRRDLVRLREGGEGVLTAFLDTVLEELLELGSVRWKKGSEVDKSWTRTAVTREAIRPRRIWFGDHGAVLPVFVPEKADGGFRPGVGRGRRDVSRVVEWLRKANQKIALLAGGRHLRLIHAGTDYDAFCEWDTDLWFQEGAPGPQVAALRALLSRDALSPEAEGRPSRLLGAIQATRQGQAELSTALGERVRLAVETLIRESAPALEAIDAPGSTHVDRRDIYIAATRIIMRCVVVLFAEARQDDLLPRNNPIYEQSYGLSSLRNQLDRLAGGRAAERLRHSHFGWPRLLALFSLLYQGSAHEALPVTRYGGGLFEPGTADSSDPVLRALAAFEGEANAPSDAAIHRILELLTSSPVKVRQGRASRWIEAPVDFSDLSSEYLGILYEGLLDFELRRAPEDDAMVFLDLGDEPVLPISRLDRMTNDELAQLLEKLAKSAKKSQPAEADSEGEDAEEEEAEEEPEGDGEVEEATPAAAPEADEDAGDGTRAIREKIQLWAERAVKAAKLVRYPRNDKDPRVREQFNQEVTARARSLIRREVMPGSWFLVRWGGTRKGSGTFYTRPQLAGPTVRRALEPLAHDPVSQTKDETTGLVTVTEWAPKKPEDILALKVCDPAMGSGSFLISALRYLTEALYESLHHHDRLEARPDGVIPRLADGLPADHPWNEALPVPREHPEFEPRLKARLKRHVVERCLYGVDLDPLAVELAKTALWVETMDPKLPFGFLDHKLKCGNSLVGCWFDRFQDYPIMAWEREGGDKGHDRFVHHYREYVGTKGKDKGKTLRSGDKWTAAIKERKEKVIRPELQRWLEERFSKQVQFEFAIEGKTAEIVHDEALAIFEEMHGMAVHKAEEREWIYKERILGSSAVQRLREAFDTWCALWFWPGDELDKAPGPMTLLAPDEAAREVVKRVAVKERFFHWELEFPDVFARPGSGFDAMVGNPPWENLQPSPREFFSSVDPLFPLRGRLESLAWMRSSFDNDPRLETSWVNYCSSHNAVANWVRCAADPFGVGLHEAQPPRPAAAGSSWKLELAGRRGFADPLHPFRKQIGRTFTHKLFLEQAAVLLAGQGMLGLLIPAGLYTDSWSGPLRSMLLTEFSWTHLYSFQNERFVFEGIHHSFKMIVLHARKGGRTSSLLTKFRIGPGDSPEAFEIEEDLLDSSRYLRIAAEQIDRFSPTTGALLEIRNVRDLAILEKLHENGVALGSQEDGWDLEYSLEYMMNSSAALFPPRPQWEATGYVPDEYGHWLKGKWCARDAACGRADEAVNSADGTMVIKIETIEDVALPLEQGAMLQQFDFCQKGWVSGTGLRAVWRPIPWSEKRVEPQFLMSFRDFGMVHRGRCKPAVRRIARNTDARMMIAGYVPRLPCGDVASVLLPKLPEFGPALVACLNSYVCDEMVRGRCGGTHVDYHYIAEIPLPRPKPAGIDILNSMTLRLAAGHALFARDWLSLVPPSSPSRLLPWRRLWAVTPHERLRLRSILDAVVAHLYGLDLDDFAWILRDCDHPVEKVTNKPFSRTLDPKGFWRVDKDKDPELRHPVLSVVAFHELKRIGLDAFLALNDGEGWMLPETLRLADYGLGHDARAQEPQPVAARLGERFLPWQLEQGVEESWEECRRHAETIEKILGITKDAAPSEGAAAEPVAGAGARKPAGPVVTATGQAMLFVPEGPAQGNLFGGLDEVKGKKGRKRS